MKDTGWQPPYEGVSVRRVGYVILSIADYGKRGGCDATFEIPEKSVMKQRTFKDSGTELAFELAEKWLYKQLPDGVELLENSSYAAYGNFKRNKLRKVREKKQRKGECEGLCS